MTPRERRLLAEAAIPLEVICGQINVKPYNEMTSELQIRLCSSLNILRQLLFSIEWDGEVANCDICQQPVKEIFIDGTTGPDQPWAIMCEECHQQHGCGLGEGRGQKYKKDGDRFFKIEG